MTSVASKWRPYILGDSPGIGSILMQISWPFLALSTDLWFTSMLVTTPMSTNWNTHTYKYQHKNLHNHLHHLHTLGGTHPFARDAERRSLSQDAGVHVHADHDGISGVKDELRKNTELHGEHRHVSENTRVLNITHEAQLALIVYYSRIKKTTTMKTRKIKRNMSQKL